ncbi:MAG: bifunctional UDP-N-acetylglucosamine diphosphorylase/glucosamine-1-phosphate N-acetyltransferase GlmU [Myxococcota bacterium]
MANPTPSLSALILAAGKGTRMRSHVAKVLHPFLGRPMVLALVDTAFRAGVDRVVTIVGHQEEVVRKKVSHAFPSWDVRFATQAEQKGTGHAVQCGLAEAGPAKSILVIYGDTPLLAPKTLAALIDQHRRSGDVLTVTTFRTADAAGYGRIVRTADGAVRRIVEHADASDDEKKIDEVNAGMCIAQRDVLAAALADLAPHNAQGEIYLTDIVQKLTHRGEQVGSFTLADPIEAAGVNTRAQLTALEEVALQRLRALWMDRGVTMQDPSSIRIEREVEIGSDTVLGPNVQLLGKTRIGHFCRIDAGAIVEACDIGDHVHVKPYCVATGARLGSGSEIGPFAHLRPGTVLGEKAKIGNFVETKKADIGARSKASHLSYLGDCVIGRDVNVGAGTITCNFDGFEKHQTVLEDGVFVGSDTQLVAPVRVGKNATIAAGTTVTADVPEGALVLSRAPQSLKAGYYEKRRKPREHGLAHHHEKAGDKPAEKAPEKSAADAADPGSDKLNGGGI